MKIVSENIYQTNNVNIKMDDPEYAKFVMESFKRFANMDWGEMDREDKEQNNQAIRGEIESRLFAAYKSEVHGTIWIITEWDSSATTILLPEDY